MLTRFWCISLVVDVGILKVRKHVEPVQTLDTMQRIRKESRRILDVLANEIYIPWSSKRVGRSVLLIVLLWLVRTAMWDNVVIPEPLGQGSSNHNG